MKAKIHPDYKEMTISCACGASYETRSVKDSYMVDICGSCHPFFTGKAKLVDREGRVERFNRKYGRRSSQPS